MRRFLSIPIALALVISSFSVSGSTFQTDHAERLYGNATTFMKAGKYKEALADFESIISDHADSERAPEALMDVGNYYLSVEQNYEKAVEYFTKIQKSYAQSPMAPAAYYRRGQIMALKAENQEELGSALADLVRMIGLYEENDWRHAVLFLQGTISARLGEYRESLIYFQNLEFYYPRSPHVPDALLESAKVTYLLGNPKQAILALVRLQSKFPGGDAFKQAEAQITLLDRMNQADVTYELDRNFFGAVPKKYKEPRHVAVSHTGVVGISAQKSFYYSEPGGEGTVHTMPTRDLMDLSLNRSGDLLLVYESRLQTIQGDAIGGLAHNGDPLKEIISAGVDNFGRVMVVDDKVRDLLAYSPQGTPLKAFGLNRPKLVRTFGDETWVLTNSESRILCFDGKLEPANRTVTGLEDIVDFCFDAFGNIYVLHEKGSNLSVISRFGQPKTSINLKNGAYPLKQAYSVAVDETGAVYLADRRGGAVYRFQ